MKTKRSRIATLDNFKIQFLSQAWERFFLNKPIIGPRVKFTYNYVGIFGVSVNFSDYFRDGMHDVRLGLDLNFSAYGFMTFFIGYGMKFSENTFDELSQFRLGLNLSLVNNRE